MDKKVQKHFLTGLKICWSLGRVFFFFTITLGRTIFNLSSKTSVFLRLFYVKQMVAPIKKEKNMFSATWGGWVVFLIVKWNDESKFWVLHFFGTFKCFRGCLNLNCYIGKKVQKTFFMGLKNWWSSGSRFFFFKSPKVGRFSIFHAKLQLFTGLGFFFSIKKNPTFFRLRDFWNVKMF